MANANRPVPYADDVETIPADEGDDIQQVVQALELILTRSRPRAANFAPMCMSKRMATPVANSRCCRTCPTNLARDFLRTRASIRLWFGFRTRPARSS